ncbi:MAG: histidine kinase N-terminal 7TM domain-containing protein [Candidatus Alcyoniella australis]|nr:histidine kinase N-terminal 7TM domain-containing protein [Candidatus Alcyoniella australis]
MTWTPHVLPTIIAFAISLSVAIYTIWTGLDRRVNRLFFMLVAACSLWILVHLFEVMEPELNSRLIWVYLQYLPINLVPVLYFLLAAEVVGYSKLLRRQVVCTLIGAYLALSLLILFDPLHHLFYVAGSTSVQPTAAGLAIVYEEGPLFWVQVAFCYLFMLLGFLLYVLSLFSEITPMLRKQVSVLLGASLIPIFANLLYLFNPFGAMVQLDLTPISIAITILLFAMAIARYKFLTITPPVTRQVLAQLPEALLFFDRRAELIDLNPAAEILLGLSPVKAIGRRLEELISPDGALRLDVQQAGLLRSDMHRAAGGDEALIRREIEIDTADGPWRNLQITFSAFMRQGEARVEGVAMRALDVTASRMAQRQREALLAISMAINNAQDVVSLCSVCVKQLAQILEMPIAGIWLYEAQHDRVRLTSSIGMTEELERKIAVQYLKPGGPGVAAQTARSRELIVLDDAASSPLLSYAMPEVLKNQSRTMICVPLVVGDELIGVIQVVSRRLRRVGREEVQTISLAAAQLAMGINRIRLLEEYTSASLSLEIQKRRTAHAELMQESFLSNMSHTMRTPMNSVLGFAKILQRGHYGAIPDEMAEPLEIIRRSGETMMRVISDVSQIGRIESGKVEIECELLHCREPVRELLSELYPETSDNGVELQETLGEACLAWADPELLREILRGLVRCAAGFSEGASVTIAAIGDNDKTEFEVLSPTASLPPSLYPQAFERFSQISNPDLKRFISSGLSLPIAKALVELHGGRIWIESRPGRGTAFRFELPRVSATPNSDYTDHNRTPEE